VVVEPYNSVFTLKSLIDSSNAGFVIDNSSLNRICTQNLKIEHPSFADINHIISQAMANDTATMRFPGAENNADLRKLCTNLIPFPRLHFLMQGQAPLISRAQTKYIKMSEGQIVKDLFDPRCLMNDADLKNGRILTGSILFRGEQVSGSEVENKIRELTDKRSS
jgi:tubulin beta